MRVWIGVEFVQSTALGTIFDLVGVFESLDKAPGGTTIKYVPVKTGTMLPKHFDVWAQGLFLHEIRPTSMTQHPRKEGN